MKKLSISLPVPERRDLSTIRERTADMAALTVSKTRRGKAKIGTRLIKLGLKLRS